MERVESQRRQVMTWDDKCWGIFNNIYWEMRFVGVQGINLTTELAERLREQNIAVPKNGRIYVRIDNEADLTKKLSSQEVVLNHFFNIAFDIASDAVVLELLCRPLGIEDPGPFESYLRGFGHERFDWGEQENVTQPDAFFLSPNSLIGVELKLDSPTWPEQIGKYLALMVWEELKSEKEAKEGKEERENLGLLFVVPEKVREQHLSKIGIDGPNLPSDFLGRLRPSKLPTRIRRLFKDNPEKLDSVRSRVRLASVSWTTLRDQISEIESELDRHSRGDQTLLRLLTGFRTQIEKHGKTGIPRPDSSS